MRGRLGMITPSSNTALEPVTCAMLADMPEVTAHFSRLRVTEIALDTPALGQFDPTNMMPAAELLSDAKVQAIAWNGTSASWLGIDRDQALCAAITAKTGAPATTSTLACLDAIHRFGARRVGLVTPYTQDVQLRIEHVWRAAGAPCHFARHLGIRDNFSFGEIAPATIADMIRDVAKQGCDAIIVLCTNMNGARVAADLERELGVLVLDSIAVTLWRSLQIAGMSGRALAPWGRIFRDAEFQETEGGRCDAI